MRTRTALVVGGGGSLGRSLVKALRNAGVASISLDLPGAGNRLADEVLSYDAARDWKEELGRLRRELHEAAPTGLDLVAHAAGTWAGGSISEIDSLDSISSMSFINLRSAINASYLGVHLLRPGALMMLTGAAAALEPTPGMIGYGLSKAATHHLIRSVAADPSLAPGCTVVGVLPDVLDTEGNRAAMPDADFSAWTNPDAVGDRVVRWMGDKTLRPESGSLVKVHTVNGKAVWTEFRQVAAEGVELSATGP